MSDARGVIRAPKLRDTPDIEGMRDAASDLLSRVYTRDDPDAKWLEGFHTGLDWALNGRDVNLAADLGLEECEGCEGMGEVHVDGPEGWGTCPRCQGAGWWK